MAPNMQIQNMSFKVGQSMSVVGTTKPDAISFSVNIGDNDENVALHLNPRFDLYGDKNTIVLNSYENGRWKEEVRPKDFGFFQDKNFKIIIKFTFKEFLITLPNGSKATFPNRCHLDKYSYFFSEGGVQIKSFEIY